jgi:hypothetical protein
MGKRIVYGVGGYDPTKPNNNIIEEVEIPNEPVDTAKETAISKLRLLGLTDEEINAIIGGTL